MTPHHKKSYGSRTRRFALMRRGGAFGFAAAVAAVDATSCGSYQAPSHPEAVAHVTSALDPADLFPTTTYTVNLLVRPPPSPTFTSNQVYLPGDLGAAWLNDTCPGPPYAQTCSVALPPCFTYPGAAAICVGASDDSPGICGWEFAYAYNYTPPLPEPFQQFDGAVPVSWNVQAALGVSVQEALGATTSNPTWASTACLLGDISQISPTAAALDNIGNISNGEAANAADTLVDALGTNGLGALGNLVQAGGSLVQIQPSTAAASSVAAFGGWLSVIGSVIGFVGSTVALVDQLSSPPAQSVQTLCLGGIVGNPTSGSQVPSDAFTFGSCANGQASCTPLTAFDLFEATATGPTLFTYMATLDYVPSNPPQWFGSCQAATAVSFQVDRTWGDGPAFQPRSADSAGVQTNNQIETFQADPAVNSVQHDSWSYANNPVVVPQGQVSCNGPSACSPAPPSRELTTNYAPSAADPEGSLPPSIGSASMPIAALSPDENDVAVFFVDGRGYLYVSQLHTSLTGTGWQSTWLVDIDPAGIPSYAPIAVLRASRDADQYLVFWVGNDSKVHDALLSTAAGPFGAVQTASFGVTASPGTTLAAVARTPLTGGADVFVIGVDASLGHAVWDSAVSHRTARSHRPTTTS